MANGAGEGGGVTAWVGRLLSGQAIGREGVGWGQLQIADDYTGPRVLVQRLPEGCPEHFPLPGEEVATRGGKTVKVVGSPYVCLGDWCVPCVGAGDGVSSYVIEFLSWPSKPKPVKWVVRTETEFESEEQAEVFKHQIRHLNPTLAEEEIP